MTLFAYVYDLNVIGRGDKASGGLQGRGQGRSREEEEFAVSATVEDEQRKGSLKEKRVQVRAKSKKRQFKVWQYRACSQCHLRDVFCDCCIYRIENLDLVARKVVGNGTLPSPVLTCRGLALPDIANHQGHGKIEAENETRIYI